jgi:hypothetical protein
MVAEEVPDGDAAEPLDQVVERASRDDDARVEPGAIGASVPS